MPAFVRIAIVTVLMLASSLTASAQPDRGFPTPSSRTRSAADREELIRLLQQRGTVPPGATAPSSRTAAPVIPEESGQPSPQEAEYPGIGPAVEVEVLFIELIADEGRPVRFSGTMADVDKQLQSLKEKGKVVSHSRISTSAVDGNKSQSQTGSVQSVQRALPAGFPAGGRTTRSYSSQNIGTIVTIIPFVDDDGAISLNLQIEKSWLQGETNGGEPGESAPLPTTATASIKNAVRIRDGRVVTVASTTQHSKGGTTQHITLATAKLAEGEKLPASIPQGPAAVRVVKLRQISANDAAQIVKKLADKHRVDLDFDARANTLVLRGESKLIGDIVTTLQVLDAEQKPADEKPKP